MDVLAVLNGVNDLRHLLFVQVLGANAWINPGFFQNDLRVGRADAVDVAQRNVDALLAGKFPLRLCVPYKIILIMLNEPQHLRVSSLTLFVARIRADDANDALALDDFAIFAKLLDGCANFHTSFFVTTMQRSTNQTATFSNITLSPGVNKTGSPAFALKMRQHPMSIGQFDPIHSRAAALPLQRLQLRWHPLWPRQYFRSLR